MSVPTEGVATTATATASPRKRRVRRIITAVGLVIIAAFVLPLISLGHYHRTIADSLSRGLGHSVHIGSVNLTLFPLPGLVIHNLVVEEDPAFGAEPLLQAPEVTVYPRLSSLWRVRLEISRIDLDNASVNLVRDPAGRWNFSSLLLQASRTASAPTAQRRPGLTPRFPYIGFSAARINFKKGAEKKAFSLLNTDASVWLADPNRWRIRLEARPARTDLDLDLEDMGDLRLDGSVTRAPSLDELPLNLHAEWEGAQLGQVSHLIFGSDSGWRGDLHADADITGDMADLLLRSRIRVTDAHRVEFTPINLLNLEARCDATYHHVQQSLDNLTCLLPTGDGHLLLTGTIPNVQSPRPDLSLEINHTPVAFAVSLFGLLRSSLPELVSASGMINGHFDWMPPASTKSANSAPTKNALTGHAVAEDVAVNVSGTDHPFTFASLRFVTPDEVQTANPQKPTHHRHKEAQPKTPTSTATDVGTVLLEPATFSAGAAKPMQVSGGFTRSGFSLHFTGEATLTRMKPLVTDFAQLGPLRGVSAKGSAQADLTFAAPWVPSFNPNTGSDSQATIQGWTRIEHAQIKPAWLPEPIEVATVTAQFGDGNITWANASISVNGIEAKGSAAYPTSCVDPAGCTAQIDLDFPTLNAAAVQSALLGAGSHGEFLEAILSSVESPAPPWPAINGTVHAGTLSIGSLDLANATASVSVRDHQLNLLSLDGTMLGGSAHASGSVQAASGGPQYALNLTWTGVKLADAGSVFHEDWGEGNIDGHATLKLHGYTDLASTATGDFHWILNGPWGGDWTGTTSDLEPSPLAASETLASKTRRPRKSGPQWVASGAIANQSLEIKSGPARGSISFSRKLNLLWNQQSKAPQEDAASPGSIQIVGTLSHPAIAPSHVVAANPADTQ